MTAGSYTFSHAGAARRPPRWADRAPSALVLPALLARGAAACSFAPVLEAPAPLGGAAGGG